VPVLSRPFWAVIRVHAHRRLAEDIEPPQVDPLAGGQTLDVLALDPHRRLSERVILSR
jgi:hypothetical protein